MRIETYEEAIELQRIGNRAVREAQMENHRLGVPSVYSRNGKLYYELPDSTLTEKDPFEQNVSNT